MHLEDSSANSELALLPSPTYPSPLPPVRHNLKLVNEVVFLEYSAETLIQTCNGYLTNADSKRPLQNQWNQIVKMGRTMMAGVESADFSVLNNPMKRSCAMIKPIIRRR